MQPSRLWILRCAAVICAIAANSPSSADESHWSFRKVTRPNSLRVRATGWLRNGIDAFVLARLEDEAVA
ncbi:MAG: hypothetical protein FD138_4612, partial [Planctomycetota bacterium]